MKVLEIKNNLVKIAYDVKDDLALSSFVIIEDANTPYVAQVMNLKADTASNFAIVKLLFTFNEEGILKNYNGTIPSLKSTISKLPSNELLDIIPAEEPIIMGQLAQQEVPVKIDKSIFENNFLVCSNNLENTTILLHNFIKQLQEKIVIFDTDGEFDWDKKIVFGQDFKLPLNYDTINFIYDNDLDDVDATSKAIIQDIFIEVQEYTKTLPEGYLPFETFLDVVDQQYRETQITQLVLLKNKLLKYRDDNVFAETLKDILNLSIAIEKTDLVVIDISNMNPNLQKEIISYTYDVMYGIKDTIYSFAKITSENADKKLLKRFLGRTNVFTTIICPHSFKYIEELKQASQNIILFAPLTLQHDFAAYNTFLNKLNSDEYIIYGAHTQNIPLIIELDEIDLSQYEEPAAEEEKTNEEAAVVPMPETQAKDDDRTSNTSETEQEQIIEEKDDETVSNIIKSVSNIFDEEEENITVENIITEAVNEADKPEIISLDENIQIVEDVQENEPVIEELPITEQIITEEPVIEEVEEEEEEIYEPQTSVVEPEIDYSVADIDIEPDFQVQEPQIIENNDDIVEQIAQDVDKALYEKLPEEETNLDELENLAADELTEDDLNLIDDITSDVSEENLEIELPDFSEQEPVPVVPIYPAEDIEPATAQTLEPGDRVSTPKYGQGVVEKMIKYGNKTLCSIEFPNIGRRLLDPAMTEITKLS